MERLGDGRGGQGEGEGARKRERRGLVDLKIENWRHERGREVTESVEKIVERETEGRERVERDRGKGDMDRGTETRVRWTEYLK